MYLVRQQFPKVFEIAIFTDRAEPDAVYHIRNGKCSCPAAWGKKSCKHQALLKEFQKAPTVIRYFEFVDSGILATEISCFQ